MESSSTSFPQTFSIAAGVNDDTQPEAITDSSSVSSPQRKRDSEVPISGVGGSSKKKLKKFLRDPRIFRTDLSRRNPPAPFSQNVKDNEPNLPRAEEALPWVKRTEFCRDYYFSEDGCKDELCRFAHGDCEVGEPFYIPPKDAIVFLPVSGKTEGRTGKCEFRINYAVVFPYIEASHAGSLFGQKREIFQWLCNLNGVKVTVEKNEEVPGFKKVVISGPMGRCLDAEILLTALLDNFVFFSESDKIPPVLDYKAVLCKKYAKGCCERDAGTCYFAHGDSELRPRSFELLEKALKARREGKYYNAATQTFVPKKKYVDTTKESYPGHGPYPSNQRCWSKGSTCSCSQIREEVVKLREELESQRRAQEAMRAELESQRQADKDAMNAVEATVAALMAKYGQPPPT